MSTETPKPKTKRTPHEYFWKPMNQSFTSVNALLNFLVEKKVLEVRERIIACDYCNPKQIFSSTNTLAIHLYTKHRDKFK